jgi:hypothetical protein
MKKIIMLIVLFVATPAFAADWTIVIQKDGVTQSSRAIEAHEIKDVQISAARTGKGSYAYFWETIGDMLRAVEKENFEVQAEIESNDIKTRMRQ